MIETMKAFVTRVEDCKFEECYVKEYIKTVPIFLKTQVWHHALTCVTNLMPSGVSVKDKKWMRDQLV